MQIMMFLSDIMIPLLIFLIIGYGLLCRHNIYEEFIEGAKDGFETVSVLPSMIDAIRPSSESVPYSL